MFTRRQLRDALKRAHWAALHCDKMEYRVVVRTDGKLEVEEWAEGSNSWFKGEVCLRKYCYFPSVCDCWFPNGKPNALDYRWAQGELIREQLDFDVNHIVEWYEDEYGVKVK